MIRRFAYGFSIAAAAAAAFAPSCSSDDGGGDEGIGEVDGGARGGGGGSSSSGGAGRGGGSAAGGPGNAGAGGRTGGSGGAAGISGGGAGGSGGFGGAGTGGAAGAGGASTNGDEAVFHFEGTAQGWTAVRGPQMPAPTVTMEKSFAGLHALKYEIEVKAEDLAQTDAGVGNRERGVGLTLHAQTIPLDQTEPFWSGKKVKLRIWFDEKPPTDFVTLFAQASDRDWVNGPAVSPKAGEWTEAELQAPSYSYPAPAQRGFAYYMTFGVYMNFVAPWKGVMYVDAVEAK